MQKGPAGPFWRLEAPRAGKGNRARISAREPRKSPRPVANPDSSRCARASACGRAAVSKEARAPAPATLGAARRAGRFRHLRSAFLSSLPPRVVLPRPMAVPLTAGQRRRASGRRAAICADFGQSLAAREYDGPEWGVLNGRTGPGWRAGRSAHGAGIPARPRQAKRADRMIPPRHTCRSWSPDR